MDAPIISRDAIRIKARKAYALAVGRDGHNFNWHSREAIAHWQHEWDQCHYRTALLKSTTDVLRGARP